jgi:hypothetical protein
MDHRLNIKPTIKLLEENTGENLYGLGSSTDFLDMNYDLKR